MELEKFHEILAPICSKEWIIWTAFEEAKTHGFDTIYFTAVALPEGKEIIIACKVNVALNDIQPYAMMLIIGSPHELNLEKAHSVAKKFNGTIVTTGESSGLIVPIDESELKTLVSKIRSIFDELGFKVSDIVIDGYYLDLSLTT